MPLLAAPPLFPQALHLTRRVDRPDGGVSVAEEYYYGNRVVSVAGDRSVIVDYEKHEIIEIDRAHSTYSITSFEKLAQLSGPAKAPRVAASDSTAMKSVPLPQRAKAAHNEYFEGQPPAASPLEKVEVGIDGTVRLSKDALEVILGSAYPRTRSDESELVLQAAHGSHDRNPRIQSASAAPAADTYGLPVDQSMTYHVGGRTVEIHNVVTRVGNEPPPEEAVAIPNGAKRVDAHAVETQRVQDQLDNPGKSQP